MKPMKLLLAVSVALALGACAAPNSYEKSLDGYAGAPEQALIAVLGEPSAVDETGGVRYLSYRQHRAFYIPAVMPLYQHICPPGDCVPLGGTKGFMLNELCTTTFAIEGGKVKSWRRDGKACVA